MKLSPSDIAKIEAILTARETGETSAKIGKRFKLGQHGGQRASVFFWVLSDMGVAVPRRQDRQRGAAEEGAAEAEPRQHVFRRRFRSAEEWQERLAALGH